MSQRMSQRMFPKRLNSYEILNENYLWALNANELQIDEKLNKILKCEYQHFSIEYKSKSSEGIKSISANN